MLPSIRDELLRALRVTLVVFVVTGLIYPFVMTGLAQGLFHSQANGSLVTKNGQVVGSTLIGQYSPARATSRDGRRPPPT